MTQCTGDKARDPRNRLEQEEALHPLLRRHHVPALAQIHQGERLLTRLLGRLDAFFRRGMLQHQRVKCGEEQACKRKDRTL